MPPRGTDVVIDVPVRFAMTAPVPPKETLALPVSKLAPLTTTTVPTGPVVTLSPVMTGGSRNDGRGGRTPASAPFRLPPSKSP